MAWTKTCHSEESTPFDLIYEALKGFFAALGMVAVAIAIGLWQAGFFQAMYDKRNDTNVAVRKANKPEQRFRLEKNVRGKEGTRSEDRNER